MSVDNALAVDVVIVGGGVAGLWTLARLRQSGIQAVLLESDALGAGQTRYAQGIIHGGTKYALTGKLTASSEAVATMPALWRECHEGVGEIDLSAAIKLSDAHYLWSTSNLSSRISGFFASKVMRARTRSLDKTARPTLFAHPEFKGQIYQLDEPVFDTLSVVRALAEPHRQAILDVAADTVQCQNNTLRLADKSGQEFQLNFKKLVLMAGQGNQALLRQLKMQEPAMQLRPLKMVMLRGGLSDTAYAHCLGASVNPRVTITSHRDEQNNIVWYLGGQLAEDGVHRDDAEQLLAAKTELSELIPWLQLEHSEWGILNINRAEVRKPDGSRPDTFFVAEHNNVLTAWPTKMALAPLLAARVVDMISGAISATDNTVLPEWQQPEYADFPWCEADRWSRS